MEFALDCYYSPIFMKKNRPAYKLSVLADSDKMEEVEDIIFSNTTSIGIRKIPVERTILDREAINISYDDLNLKYKKVSHEESTYVYPEYQSAIELSRREGLSIKKAFNKLKEIYGENYEDEI